MTDQTVFLPPDNQQSSADLELARRMLPVQVQAAEQDESTDIIAELRVMSQVYRDKSHIACLDARALRAEVERLRIALAAFADRGNWFARPDVDGEATLFWSPESPDLLDMPWRIAQKALDGAP